MIYLVYQPKYVKLEGLLLSNQIIFAFMTNFPFGKPTSVPPPLKRMTYILRA